MAPLAPAPTQLESWFWPRLEHCVQDAVKGALTEQSCGKDPVAQVIILVEPKLIENDYNERFAPVRLVAPDSPEVDEIMELIKLVLPAGFELIDHGFGRVDSLDGMSQFPTRSWNSYIENPLVLFYTIKVC